MAVHLSAEQVRMALRLRARGLTLKEVGRQVSCHLREVHRLTREEQRRAPRPFGWEPEPGPGRLTLADREEISLGLHAGEPFTVIAGRLGRAVSTVSREAAGNDGREGYRAWRRISGPGSGPAGRRSASWMTPGWPRRSARSWRAGGPRSRSRPGYGSPIRTIR